MKENRFFVFNNGRLLLFHHKSHYNIYVGDIDHIPVSTTQLHCFERTEQASYVCSSNVETLPDNYEWIDLRQSYHLLPLPLYHKAGKASEILHFDTTNKYCGRCGAAMQWASPISKQCTGCHEEIWPQLSTAIIVLVHKGEKALLVKAKSFRRNFYGLVAGFVETGESLEECVHREVYEETGLEITNLRYFGSQPWPYPMGLMVGFHADYKSGELKLIDGELKEAAFFSRDQLPTIPEKLSMARMLIDDWTSKDCNEPSIPQP